jgi:Protein of unknown function (DUF2808)
VNLYAGWGLIGVSVVLGWMSGKIVPAAQAIQLSDGTVYFAKVPQLVGAATNDKAVGSLAPTYRFTINLPADAGVPMQRVTLVQTEGAGNIRFNLSPTTAYVGKNRQALLPLGNISQDPQTRAIEVSFQPAIAPGTIVTIALRPVQNPSIGGTYLFGVTAYPQGEKAHGQFLGYGRLQFYQQGFLFPPLF